MNIRNYTLCTFIVILLISLPSSGQNKPNKVVNNNHIEQLISSSNLESATVDELVDKLTHKININRTTREELTRLLILSPSQIESILTYVDKVGRLESVYELQLIKGLDYTTLQNLAPFVFVDTVYSKLDVPYSSRVKQKLSVRYDQPFYRKKGDLQAYQGKSFYTAFRYHCSLNNKIEFGLLGEKDAGETFFTFKNDRGFDYYSYYFVVNNIYNIKTLILGKYRLSLGNGLVMGASQYGGKWYAISSFFNTGQAIRKHASVDEYNYLQGVSLNYQIKNFKVLPFLSYRLKDGAIKEGKISSISKTGLHRTQTELEKQNTIKEWCYGLHLNYHKPYFELGLNSVFYQFNYPIQKGSQKYMKYDLEGNNFYNLSLDYLFYYSKFILRGESALSKKGVAFMHKLYYAPTTDWDILLVHRFYSVDYWSLYGNSFSNSSKLQNENGWYFTVQTRYFNALQLSFFADFASYPWKKYRVSKPSQAIELGLKIDYNLQANHKLLFQLSNHFKERDRSGTKGTKIDALQLHKLKFQYTGLAAQWCAIQLISAVHLFQAEKKSEGYHLSSRVSLLNLVPGFNCDLQYSYFHTQDFDSRVYIFEKGVLYGMYSPSFYGKGHRCSINMKYKLKQNMTFMAKYGLTYYLDRNRIGSGLDEIKGNSKSDIQLMGVLNF